MDKVEFDSLPERHFVTSVPSYDTVFQASRNNDAVTVDVETFTVNHHWHPAWEGKVKPTADIDIGYIKLLKITAVSEGSDEKGFSFRCLIGTTIVGRGSLSKLTENRLHEVNVLGSTSLSSAKVHIRPCF